MSETTIKTGKVDLEKLLKRTKHHPKGRVQIDDNGEVKNPKNPVVSVEKVSVIEDGKVVEKEIPRFQGQVKGEGSVWRIAMCKPRIAIAGKLFDVSCPEEAYHQMCLVYEERKGRGKGSDDFRPELSAEEMASYVEWKKKKSETKA